MTPVYNLLEYNSNYSKASRILCQYYQYEPAFDDDGDTINFDGISITN